jgi:two-component system cell cycle sensor histidine kinase/response regulator CckA
MRRRNEPRGPAGQGRHEGTAELQHAAWLSAAALAAIALTVSVTSLAGAGHRWHSFIALVVCIEIAVVIGAISWLTRQIMRHARTLEGQRLLLETQASELGNAAVEAEEARARAEGEMRQKARVVALLDAALATSPVGFGFFDPQLRFLRVNAALARINNRATEDHVGATLSDIDPRLAAKLEPMLERVLSTREPISNVEFGGIAPAAGGRPHSWLTSGFPIITADGDLFGVGIAVTDITEFKQLEEQFLQAQKMEAVGRLAGGVAHDFNNLLTVINSYAELMLYDPEMSRAHVEVEEIRGAAARAAKLTRQLLAFSRRQAMEPRLVSPNDVLRGVETLLRRLVVGNVDIVTRLAVDTPLIRVDPGQLEQVLMNLAINAADAMPDGGSLRIETACSTLGEEVRRADPELVAGDYAVIRVSDTGHGMDTETVAKIFEPFFTTKEPGRGTGLGLSTAYGIVKQFGGHIDVDSHPNAGTVFTVYLPTATKGELVET